MKRNVQVINVVNEIEMLKLFRKGITDQIKFKKEAEVFERAEKCLRESREKHIATVHDVIPRIFACLFIASETLRENITRKTIGDLGGVSQPIITKISDEIGLGLDMRHMW